ESGRVLARRRQADHVPFTNVEKIGERLPDHGGAAFARASVAAGLERAAHAGEIGRFLATPGHRDVCSERGDAGVTRQELSGARPDGACPSGRTPPFFAGPGLTAAYTSTGGASAPPAGSVSTDAGPSANAAPGSSSEGNRRCRAAPASDRSDPGRSRDTAAIAGPSAARRSARACACRARPE